MTVPSQPPKIQLIPWDPYSEEHIERLILQRIACGWHEDFVRNIWCQQQKEGHKSLFWIVRPSFNISHQQIVWKEKKLRFKKGPHTLPHNIHPPNNPPPQFPPRVPSPPQHHQRPPPLSLHPNRPHLTRLRRGRPPWKTLLRPQECLPPHQLLHLQAASGTEIGQFGDGRS